VKPTEEVRDAIRNAAIDPEIVRAWMSLAHFTADIFRETGGKLHAFGHMLGTDRREGVSRFGHGDDAAVDASARRQLARFRKRRLDRRRAALRWVGAHLASR
jgi:hypothetical protein